MSGPATPQFFQVYDPGGYLAPIAYPPGGVQQYRYPTQSQAGGSPVNLVGLLLVVGLLLLFEHFRPK